MESQNLPPNRVGGWVALKRHDSGYDAKGHVTNSNGVECEVDNRNISVIEPAAEVEEYGNGSGYRTLEEIPHHRFTPALELKPNDSKIVTLKFNSHGTQPEPGFCTLQLELLLGHDFVPGEAK